MIATSGASSQSNDLVDGNVVDPIDLVDVDLDDTVAPIIVDPIAVIIDRARDPSTPASPRHRNSTAVMASSCS